MDRAYIKDLRHRYSYELRPAADLDHAIRDLAGTLEARGHLEPGSSTAPRFQPHLTMCRAAILVPEAVMAGAAHVADAGAAMHFTDVVTFGHGRIICLVPDEAGVLEAGRAAVIARIDPSALDPAVHARAWTPHVTVAYAVPDDQQAAALDLVRLALPIAGTWERAQAWDLDVRPTRCEVDLPCVRPRGHG